LSVQSFSVVADPPRATRPDIDAPSATISSVIHQVKRHLPKLIFVNLFWDKRDSSPQIFPCRIRKGSRYVLPICSSQDNLTDTHLVFAGQYYTGYLEGE
jgi:hypothetical protein